MDGGGRGEQWSCWFCRWIVFEDFCYLKEKKKKQKSDGDWMKYPISTLGACIEDDAIVPIMVWLLKGKARY